MAGAVKSYLEEIRTHLHLKRETAERVMTELSSHFQEKMEDLERSGMSEEEAERASINSFGDPRDIARRMYEANSRGTWGDALLSCQPHLLAAALFATHLWRNPYMLAVAFGAITLITIWSWRGGSPVWMYSWAGYAFFPLLIFVFISRHPIAATVSSLLRGSGTPAPAWELVLLAISYGVTIWLVVSSSIHVASQDWLYASLMLLPLPVLGMWALSVEHVGDSLMRLFAPRMDVVARWDSVMAVFCLSLGITSALFVRLRQRALKTAAIMLIGIVGGALVIRSLWSETGLARLLFVSAGLLAFLIAPILLHNFFGRDVTPKET